MVRKLSLYPNIYTDKPRKPMFVFCFDDGNKSDRTLTAPYLRSNGIRGTYWVIGGRLTRDDLPTYLNEQEMIEISEMGHEIGCHTLSHSRLSALSDQEIIEELGDNKKYLESLTGKTVLSHAYPFGDFDERVVNLAGAFYEGARAYGWGSEVLEQGNYAMPYGNDNTYKVPGMFLENQTVDDVKGYIDDFLEWSNDNGGGLFVLSFHRIYATSDDSKPDNRWNSSQFRAIVDYVANLKMEGKADVVPFYEAVRRLRV